MPSPILSNQEYGKEQNSCLQKTYILVETGIIPL